MTPSSAFCCSFSIPQFVVSSVPFCTVWPLSLLSHGYIVQRAVHNECCLSGAKTANTNLFVSRPDFLFRHSLDYHYATVHRSLSADTTSDLPLKWSWSWYLGTANSAHTHTHKVHCFYFQSRCVFFFAWNSLFPDAGLFITVSFVRAPFALCWARRAEAHHRALSPSFSLSLSLLFHGSFLAFDAHDASSKAVRIMQTLARTIAVPTAAHTPHT